VIKKNVNEVLNDMFIRDHDDDDEKKKARNPFDLFNDDQFFGMNFFNEIMKRMMEMDEGNQKMGAKSFGPYIWGYNMTVGPDGKPRIKRFGNVKTPMNRIQQKKNDENLIDVFNEKDQVKIIVELPGVKKENIKVRATESKVFINAKGDQEDHNAEKELSVEIKPKTASTKYKNGILEITFERKEPSNEEVFEIDIE
jgi:HSP20 family protein